MQRCSVWNGSKEEHEGATGSAQVERHYEESMALLKHGRSTDNDILPIEPRRKSPEPCCATARHMMRRASATVSRACRQLAGEGSLHPSKSV